MAIWTRNIITNVGKNLIAQCQAESKALNITKCALSSHNYYNESLSTLTALEDIKQEANINEKYVESNDKVKVLANFDNTQLTTGYKLYTFGVYANNGGSDILFLVGCTDAPDNVPVVSKAPWQTIISSPIKIDNAPDITINVDLAGNATIGYVDEEVSKKVDKKKTTGQYAYTHNGETQGEIKVANDTTASTIAQRDTKGLRASTPAGSNDTYLLNKGFLNSYVDVAMPTTGWSGPTNGLYSKTLKVANMYSKYSGVRACDFVRSSNVLTTIEAQEEAFALIKNIVSNNGSVTVYAEAIPTTPITLRFYGV